MATDMRVTSQPTITTPRVLGTPSDHVKVNQPNTSSAPNPGDTRFVGINGSNDRFVSLLRGFGSR